MIKQNTLLIIVWIIYICSDYYILPYFVRPFLWLLICLVLLGIFLKQAIKLFKERKNIKHGRLLTFMTAFFLSGLTFYNINALPRALMEKMDWMILYQKRRQIVTEVLHGQLKPNTTLHNGICRLPFTFPIVSNGGNDIWIAENKTKSTKTIKFWISRNFFDAPQDYFVFTNDNETLQYYRKLIKVRPQHNRQLDNNWFRVTERE